MKEEETVNDNCIADTCNLSLVTCTDTCTYALYLYLDLILIPYTFHLCLYLYLMTCSSALLHKGSGGFKRLPAFH